MIKKNPGVASALSNLESDTRDRGVPPLTEEGEKAQLGPTLYDKKARRASMDFQRVAHLESDNH
ncbi:MAG: hypothetical protein JJ956_19680, partial [Pseudomonadales bacterium]|nr:hypothetical protein [Pseudomonadales bacterium]